jgi:hypothetical protein
MAEAPRNNVRRQNIFESPIDDDGATTPSPRVEESKRYATSLNHVINRFFTRAAALSEQMLIFVPAANQYC